MKFFISDIHDGHANIIKYCNRPFANVFEMRQAIIANWNGKVRPDDEVYVGGDVSFTNPEKTAELLDKLNGIKYLIKGNHDKIALKEPALSKWAWVKDYYELTYQDNRGPDRTQKPWFFVLSHYPFLTWNRSHHGSVNLCGHRHMPHAPDKPPICSQCGFELGRVRRYDIGVDANNYYPISIEEVIDKVKDIKVGHEHYKGEV